MGRLLDWAAERAFKNRDFRLALVAGTQRVPLHVIGYDSRRGEVLVVMRRRRD